MEPENLSEAKVNLPSQAEVRAHLVATGMNTKIAEHLSEVTPQLGEEVGLSTVATLVRIAEKRFVNERLTDHASPQQAIDFQQPHKRQRRMGNLVDALIYGGGADPAVVGEWARYVRDAVVRETEMKPLPVVTSTGLFGLGLA